MADGNTDLLLGAGIITAFGVIAGAFLKIFQLTDRVKKDGAWKQKIEDDMKSLHAEIKNLREDITRDKGIDQKLFDEIKKLHDIIVNAQKDGVHQRQVLKDMIHNAELTSTREHNSLSERLVKLEASGCKPAKEKAS